MGSSPFPLEMFSRYVSKKHVLDSIGKEFNMITDKGVEVFFQFHPETRDKVWFEHTGDRKVVMRRAEAKEREKE